MAPDTLDARVQALHERALAQLRRGARRAAGHNSFARARRRGLSGDNAPGVTGTAAGETVGGRARPSPRGSRRLEGLRAQTPLDYYRGWALGRWGRQCRPSKGDSPPADRWAWLCRERAAAAGSRGRGAGTCSLVSVDRRNVDDAILAALGLDDSAGPAALDEVAAVRSFQGDSGAAATPVFDQVRAQADSAFAMARTGVPPPPRGRWTPT